MTKASPGPVAPCPCRRGHILLSPPSSGALPPQVGVGYLWSVSPSWRLLWSTHSSCRHPFVQPPHKLTWAQPVPTAFALSCLGHHRWNAMSPAGVALPALTSLSLIGCSGGPLSPIEGPLWCPAAPLSSRVGRSLPPTRASPTTRPLPGSLAGPLVVAAPLYRRSRSRGPCGYRVPTSTAGPIGGARSCSGFCSFGLSLRPPVATVELPQRWS